jgi:hypothetical protein
MCVGLELEDNLPNRKVCPKKKKISIFFLSMLYIVTRVDWDFCEEGPPQFFLGNFFAMLLISSSS